VTEPGQPRPAFAPWDRRELPGLFGVVESARRAGARVQEETRVESLEDVDAGAVVVTAGAWARPLLARQCYHHAWHAELWNKRLPELREMNTERLTEPPNDAMVQFIDAVREPEAPELTIEKLVGVYRVLIPRKIAAYTFHLNATSRITDAPTMRSLKFILQDEFDDWREGEMLLQSLISTPEEVDRAASRQRELEQLMLAAGGITGPGSIGTGEEAGAEASEGVAVG